VQNQGCATAVERFIGTMLDKSATSLSKRQHKNNRALAGWIHIYNDHRHRRHTHRRVTNPPDQYN